MRGLKTTSFLLAVMAALMLPCTAGAYDFESEGIYYSILDDNSVEVTNNRDAKYAGHVIIPEVVTHNDTVYQVTAIGEFAFYNCPDLTDDLLEGNLNGVNADVDGDGEVSIHDVIVLIDMLLYG